MVSRKVHCGGFSAQKVPEVKDNFYCVQLHKTQSLSCDHKTRSTKPLLDVFNNKLYLPATVYSNAYPVPTSVGSCVIHCTSTPPPPLLWPRLQVTCGILSLALVSATGARAVFTGSSSLSHSNSEKWITWGRGTLPRVWRFASILEHMGEMVNQEVGAALLASPGSVAADLTQTSALQHPIWLLGQYASAEFISQRVLSAPMCPPKSMRR